MSGGGDEVVVGYKYYVGMHLGICQGPIDKITEIRIGERTAWSGNASSGIINIDKPELFGGEDREGGVVGQFEIQMGGPTQGKNSYLLSKLGDVPAFRGIFSIVLRSPYLGNIPRFKPLAVTGERVPQGWPGAISGAIGSNGDSNPTHMIYELITNPHWGMRYNDSRVDLTSFDAAAAKLLAENFGLSFFWSDDNVDIESFMQTIMSHIDGSVYLDVDTAKWRIKLHRDDFDVSTLPWLDESNIMEVVSFKRPSWGELVNEVTVEYVDGEGFEPSWKPQSLSIQNLAVIQAQGGQIVNKTINYDGVTNAALADRLASRDLRQLSTPLARLEVILTASQRSLKPGDVRRLKYADHGIEQLVVRVVEIEYGTVDDGQIKATLIEDVFAHTQSEFAPPPPTAWVDPVSDPAAAPYRKITEATYWHIAQLLGDNDSLLAQIEDTDGFLFTQAVRPSDDAFNYEVHVDAGGGYKLDGQRGYFTPSTTNTAIVPPAAQSVIAIDNTSAVKDIDLVVVPTLAYWGDEIIEVTAIDFVAGTITANRGVLDTTPVEHAVGERFFFGQGFESRSRTEYNDNETVSVKMLPSTSRGRLPIGSPPFDQITFDSRFARPIAPGRIRVNGLDFPIKVTGANSLSWSHRDRTLQTGAIIDQNAASIGPEPGTTYTVRIFDGDTATLRRTITAISGTSQNYTEADEVADGGYIGTLTWQVEAVRDGFASWQFQERTVELHGYGRRYGESYGGI